jgi:hypothetical protein
LHGIPFLPPCIFTLTVWFLLSIFVIFFTIQFLPPLPPRLFVSAKIDYREGETENVYFKNGLKGTVSCKTKIHVVINQSVVLL